MQPPPHPPLPLSPGPHIPYLPRYVNICCIVPGSQATGSLYYKLQSLLCISIQFNPSIINSGLFIHRSPFTTGKKSRKTKKKKGKENRVVTMIWSGVVQGQVTLQLLLQALSFWLLLVSQVCYAGSDVRARGKRSSFLGVDLIGIDMKFGFLTSPNSLPR